MRAKSARTPAACLASVAQRTELRASTPGAEVRFLSGALASSRPMGDDGAVRADDRDRERTTRHLGAAYATGALSTSTFE